MRTGIDITFLSQKMLDGLFYLRQQKILGEKIDHVCRVIEKENQDLDGVLTNTKYNDKRKYPDDKLTEINISF